jgi:hypothetical protein
LEVLLQVQKASPMLRWHARRHISFGRVDLGPAVAFAAAHPAVTVAAVALLAAAAAAVMASPSLHAAAASDAAQPDGGAVRRSGAADEPEPATR